MVLSHSGSASPIEYLPLPEDDPQQPRPETVRAREILGWEAVIPLHVGLPLTIDFFKTAI